MATCAPKWQPRGLRITLHNFAHVLKKLYNGIQNIKRYQKPILQYNYITGILLNTNWHMQSIIDRAKVMQFRKTNLFTQNLSLRKNCQ